MAYASTAIDNDNCSQAFKNKWQVLLDNKTFLSVFLQKNRMKIQLKVGRKIVFVDSSEIQYIQSNNIYCDVFLQNGERIVCTSTLAKLEATLKSSSCFQTHRCYIVNKAAIRSVDLGNLSIELKYSEKLIPIARSKKKQLAASDLIAEITPQ